MDKMERRTAVLKVDRAKRCVTKSGKKFATILPRPTTKKLKQGASTSSIVVSSAIGERKSLTGPTFSCSSRVSANISFDAAVTLFTVACLRGFFFDGALGSE